MLMLMCLWVYGLRAQTITIGTGTTSTFNTSQSATSAQSPWNSYYGYTYAQTIYLQSEIAATGNITSIDYYFDGASLSANADIKVWMKVITRSSFSSTTDWEPISGMTLVYDGTFAGSTPGWVNIPLQTPFPYNNTGNLVIAIDENTPSDNGATGFRYSATAAGSNRVIFYRSDGTNPDPATPPTAGGRSNQIGNIQINGLTLACQSPGNLAAAYSAGSATITWDAPAAGPAATAYKWELRTSGNPGSGATGLLQTNTTATPSVVINNPPISTFYVKSNCTSATDTSSWKSLVLLPNDEPCGAPLLTAGTSCVFTSATNAGATASAGIPAPGCASYSGGDVWFRVGVPASGALIFDSNSGIITDGGMAIYSSSDNTCNGSLTLIECDDDDSQNGAMPMINKTGLNPGDTVFIRFWEYGNDNNGTFSICVSEPPTPPVCTTIIAPIDGASAVPVPVALSWNAVAAATSYDIYLSTTNPPTTTVATSVTGTTYNYTAAYNTTYYWYVSPKNAGGNATGCDGTISSFTTDAPPPPPVNDEPCNAADLTIGATVPVCSNTVNASYTSSSEPSITSCSTPNNTVWYKFTPAVDGNYVIVASIPSASTNPLSAWFYLYTTSDCNTASAFTSAGGISCVAGPTTAGSSSNITTTALTAGVTYYLYVDGNSGDVGDICIRVEQAPTPPSCTTILTPTDGATAVTVPVALSWTAAPTATGYNVYAGTTNPPTTLVATNITATNFSYAATSYNTTYYWYVVPRNTGGLATGCDGTISSFTTDAPPPPPANDDCSGAVNLTGGVTVNSSTISATQSMAPEACATYTSLTAGDVWFQLTATQNGAASVTVQGPTGFDLVIQAYSGTCGSLTNIGCADATIGPSTETFNFSGLTAGQTVYFRVYGYSTTAGVFNQNTFTVTASGTALPVTYSSLSGSRINNVNRLTWTTSTEINNTGFELQRSADGVSFSKLAFVASKALNGNSNVSTAYSFNDVKPYISNGYYRLKQIDKDGRSSLSNVVMIKGGRISTVTLSSVYPNPVKSDVNVIVSSPNAEKLTVIITDLSGKVIKQQITNAVIGDNKVTLNVSNLASGTYLIKVQCANGCETSVQKFVKN